MTAFLVCVAIVYVVVYLATFPWHSDIDKIIKEWANKK
jgi:nitrogen fixation-related uncharacterized protein